MQMGDHSMLANAIKFAIAVAVFALFTISANAQDIHPRCVKVANAKARVNCSCFFASGGVFEYSPGRGKRRAVFWTLGQFDAHVACMRRHGYAYE
jgi:hypothetical protein